MKSMAALQQRLQDRRGRQVVFLSHCLLNENTRYLGGAFSAGCVRDVVAACSARGYGMVQMPCPEERAWGGLLKPFLLAAVGSRGTLLYRLRGFLFPVFIWHTRRIYRRLARATARQMADYVTHGYTVVRVVGIDGSPSCGVSTTLDMKQSFDRLARMEVESVTVDSMNDLINQCLVPGRGLFTRLLQEQLARRGISVVFTAHDLIAELDGQADSSAAAALYSG